MPPTTRTMPRLEHSDPGPLNVRPLIGIPELRSGEMESAQSSAGGSPSPAWLAHANAERSDPGAIAAGADRGRRLRGYRITTPLVGYVRLRSPTGLARMPWNDSWNEHQQTPRATCAFRAYSPDIGAGSALGAVQRSSFNPWVPGSSPGRPTCSELGFHCHAVHLDVFPGCSSGCSCFASAPGVWPAAGRHPHRASPIRSAAC